MMRKENKPNKDNKKGFPGGWLLIGLASVLVFLTVQNLSNEKKADVAYAHQAEHLVNLDLIHKNESRKISLGGNLVTFTGRFKDGLSEAATQRYRYLELLEKNHDYRSELQELSASLNQLEVDVKSAATAYLQLMGKQSANFAVVQKSYDRPERISSIIINNKQPKVNGNFPELERLAVKAKTQPAEIALLGTQLKSFVETLLSPSIGVGSEELKEDLKGLDQRIAQINLDTSLSNEEKLSSYVIALNKVEKIKNEIEKEVDHARLIPLRSVRKYLDNLDQFQYVTAELEKNTFQLQKARSQVANVTWFFNNKELSTKALERENSEEFHHWFTGANQEWTNYPANQSTVFKAPDQPRNAVVEKNFKSEEPSPNYMSYLFTFMPILLILFLLYYVFARQMKGMGGGGAMNFGKSTAKLLTADTMKVTFADVAGVEEAKEELEEIVDFLKDPTKFTSLGARIPKGVLCVGPPGTGKTLIARAVAGEADRPFFSISGSDFVEMFVGVGASRIRDLFAQAKKSAPCIIFIDEIDAVGRHRGGGVGGGHDEREQTLNQLLVEMDGFDTNEGVILIAATNRPDVLDKALLRPGRFDRRVVLDLPDLKGRFEILKVHASKIKLDDNVELMEVARGTAGASGADLMNILNEAALMAARNGRSAVTHAEAKEAMDKVRYGKERRSLERDEQEKLTTAYHESGHAIVGLMAEHGDTVDKVTIIPRGFSLGATHFLPKKNRVSYWKKELLDQLATLMGGRIAEEIFVGDISSGAQMDIEMATKLARSMVCQWGMTEHLGAVSYDAQSESGQFLTPDGSISKQNYSEETAKAIDEEVRKLIDEGYAHAKKIILDKRNELELMTQMLMEFESLDKEDVLEIIEGKWDTEKKRARLKELEEKSQRKTPPPPPEPILPIDTIDPTPQGA